VIALTGSKSRIEFAKLPVDDPMLRRPDITIAQEKLGWAPSVDLEAGLVKTIAYFDELLTSGAATQPADVAPAPRRRMNGRSASGRSAVLAA
jgi:UDP-glucuronate decarboxylase